MLLVALPDFLKFISHNRILKKEPCVPARVNFAPMPGSRVAESRLRFFWCGKGARIYPKGCKVRNEANAAGDGITKYNKQGLIEV